MDAKVAVSSVEVVDALYRDLVAELYTSAGDSSAGPGIDGISLQTWNAGYYAVAGVETFGWSSAAAGTVDGASGDEGHATCGCLRVTPGYVVKDSTGADVWFTSGVCANV